MGLGRTVCCVLLKILQHNPPPEYGAVLSVSLGKLLTAAISGLSFGAGQAARFLLFKIWGLNNETVAQILIFNQNSEILNCCELFLVKKHFIVEAQALFPLPGL